MRMIAVFIAGLIVGLSAPVYAQGVDHYQNQLNKIIDWSSAQTSLTTNLFEQLAKLEQRHSKLELLFSNCLEQLNTIDTATLNRVAELERRYSKLEQEVKNRPKVITIQGEKL